MLTDVYALTYVPDGYELTQERITPVNVLYKFENTEGKILIFEQRMVGTDGSVEVIEDQLVYDYE